MSTKNGTTPLFHPIRSTFRPDPFSVYNLAFLPFLFFSLFIFYFIFISSFGLGRGSSSGRCVRVAGVVLALLLKRVLDGPVHLEHALMVLVAAILERRNPGNDERPDRRIARRP